MRTGLFRLGFNFLIKTKLILWLSLFFVSCAQIVAPTGGDKDVVSPKIIKSSPQNFAVNYKEKTFSLVFDEYIQVRNWNKVIFSPPLKSISDYRLNGKKLTVSWEDTLLDNTTYTVNFGKSILDNNEGNPLDSNLLVFSTGEKIDSSGISGIVANAIDHKAVKDVLIMLYKDNEDSLPFKKMPDYYSISDETGKYRINHVKSGKYKLFALNDNNQNFLFDQPDESIAFSDSIITIDTSIVIDHYLFKEESPKFFVKKAVVPHYGKVSVVMNKPSEKIVFESLRSDLKNENVLIETNFDKDSLSFWVLGNMPDSISLIIKNERGFQDTLLIDLPQNKDIESSKDKSLKRLKLSFSSYTSEGNPLDYGHSLKLEFNIPIAKSNFKNVILSNGTDTLKSRCFFDDDACRVLYIDYPFHPDSSYKIFIPDSTFIDVFGDYSDSISFGFAVRNTDYYSTLSISIKNLNSNLSNMVQLLDEKQLLVKEKFMNTNQKLVFDKLAPGKYFLKLIADKDKNGRWTTGKYIDKRQPESIYFYKDPINVKSNWDVDLEWELK